MLGTGENHPENQADPDDVGTPPGGGDRLDMIEHPVLNDLKKTTKP